MNYEVIIIGAGASGLIAGATLAEAGIRCAILEAAPVAGGRMCTTLLPGFSTPVERGAEFIHGDLPLTLTLLDKAGIRYVPVEGEMISIRGGQWLPGTAHDPHWPAFLQILAELKTDCSLQDLLDRDFHQEKYSGLREAVQSFAQGFDLADLSRASATSAQREWGSADENQYRVEGGYQELATWLVNRCLAAGVSVYYDKQVTEVSSEPAMLTVTCNRGGRFTASRVMVTVSAGILQAGQIQFRPVPDARYTGAMADLGFGPVIKFLFEFRERFWERYASAAGFLLSDEVIPTWWTNNPLSPYLLTGWVGGPPAAALSAHNDEALKHLALVSLSGIFSKPPEWVQDQLTASSVACWQRDPFTRGGYSYPATTTAAARKILSHPLHGQIYFSGEALWQGKSQGTVEAALQQGRETAQAIIGAWQQG